jgi:hypothetical protein
MQKVGLNMIQQGRGLMKTFVFVLLLLVSTIATAQSTVEVNVPSGDLDALRQAMNAAAAGDPSVLTIIYTSGTFNFTDSAGIPDVHTQVFINGDSDPITFLNAGGYARPFVTISEEGWLQLRNTEIKDFDLTGVGSFIVNQGKLDLELVQFDSVKGYPRCSGFGLCSPNPTLFNNSASGQLSFHQVSFINSGVGAVGIEAFNQNGLIRNYGSVDIQDTQIYLGSDNWSIPIMNYGLLALKNVSIFHSNYDGQFKNVPMKTMSGAQTYVSNSIISGFSDAWCDNATSLGHNHIDNDQCNFNANGDVTGEPTGLLWREIGDDLRSGWHSSSGNPILKYALVPVATSLAVDSIDPELCASHDLLLQGRKFGSDGNGDGISKCDKGAVEAQTAYIADGGINGVYYNPDADGHYITIIDNPYNTLVMWNSFDKDGNQYFVHGTGELVADRSLVADAYIHVSGSTSPEGEIVPAQELHWGTLEVEMSSCNEGILAFNSDFPEVGSGQVRLQRLVFVKQLGCVD